MGTAGGCPRPVNPQPDPHFNPAPHTQCDINWLLAMCIVILRPHQWPAPPPTPPPPTPPPRPQTLLFATAGNLETLIDPVGCVCSCTSRQCCDNTAEDMVSLCGPPALDDAGHRARHSRSHVSLLIASAFVVACALGVAMWIGGARLRQRLSLSARRSSARLLPVDGCVSVLVGGRAGGEHDA
jgi:hypothetical protein